MRSTAEIIYTFLVDQGLVNVGDDWPATVSFMPDYPHQAVAVFDVAGINDGRISDGTRIEHDGIQIQVRDKVYVSGWLKAKAIADALDNLLRESVAVESDTSYLIQNVTRTGTILPVGIDENDGQRRHYFTINGAVTVREA